MDVFELFAKINLDTSEYDIGLDNASKKTSGLGTKLKGGLATAGKVAAAGIAAATTAVGALAKTSLDGYAEYEQLVGGVETLFKTSSDVVMEYADNAYKTAGLSANEYMSTVTSFSASLLQSLGGDTQKAAEKADRAITDMADNANKMGTSIDMIQNAYQGFAKQNYTMLDNLKLGYGGTKTEMERLLKDAEKLPKAMGRKFDISNYADVVDAIHLVQTEMGISGISAKEAADAVASGAMTQEEAFAAIGTTAKEAKETIQGSVSSVKSAWSNLVTGIGDENANLGVLIGNFVDSITTAGENIIPRIGQILVGVGEAVTKLAPILSEKIPEIITTVMPTMLGAGVKLLLGLVTGLINAIPNLIAAIPTIIETFVTTIKDNLPAIADAGKNLLSMFKDGILNGIPNMIAELPKIIDNFLNFITEHLPDILAMGVEILSTLGQGIINGIVAFVQNLPQIITSFVNFITENLPKIVEAGITLIKNLVIGIVKAIPELVKALPQIIVAIVTGIGKLLFMIIEIGGQIITALWDGIKAFAGWLGEKIAGFFGGIIDGIKNFFSSFVDIGANLIKGIWEGIKNAAGWLWDKVTGFFGGIVDGVKDFLGIKSPSRVFAGIGKNMALGLGEGWDDEYSSIKKDIENGMDFGTPTVDFASSAVGVSTAGMVNGITAGMNQGMGMAPMTFKLVLPSGVELATYLLDPLASVANANGTPILNPA